MTITEGELSEILYRRAEAVAVRDQLEDVVEGRPAVSPPRRSRRRRRATIVAITAGTVLVAGGAAAALTGHLPRAVNYKSEMRSAAVSAALKDEQVTFDEYQAGFHRYETCVANAGHPLQDVTFNEAIQLYQFITGGSPAEEDCYQAEWYALDVAWQLNPTRPGFNPVTLLDMRRACGGDQKAIDKVTKYQKLYDSQCQHIENAFGTLP